MKTTEHPQNELMESTRLLTLFAQQGAETLYEEDPVLASLLEGEYHRQANVLSMVASTSIEHASVLAVQGMMLTNVTAEGYPGKRYHGGCQYIDEVEQLAIDRAKRAFDAQYANVQPHSASSANEIILCKLLSPGDTILGLGLDSGGHLTHGAKASFSGRYFNAIEYGLDSAGMIDYDQVSRLAQQHRPKLIICGTTSYPRTIDFKRFRAIADAVGAFLLADMTHIAGLVAAGLHPSPIQEAHFTTTCTHKQLYGPRGGLILMGRDADTLLPGTKQTLASMVQNAVFPYFQGTPAPNIMAGKARAMARVVTPQFRALAARIVADAKALAEALIQAGHTVISGGTDNHIVLFDVSRQGLSGIAAQKALEESGIIVNKNKIPGDKKSATVTSGIRLGSNSVACRDMAPKEMKECIFLLDKVLRSTQMLSDTEYRLDEQVSKSVKEAVAELCQRFPLPYASFLQSATVLKAAAGVGELSGRRGLEEYRG